MTTDCTHPRLLLSQRFEFVGHLPHPIIRYSCGECGTRIGKHEQGIPTTERRGSYVIHNPSGVATHTPIPPIPYLFPELYGPLDPYAGDSLAARALRAFDGIPPDP